MRASLSPRPLAAFGALILLIAGLGVFALSLMGDLSQRVSMISADNIPELIATDDVQLALQEFRQLQLRSQFDARPAEREARAPELLRLATAITVGLQERGRIAPEAGEKAEVTRLLALWRRYLLDAGLTASPAAGRLTGVAERDFAALERGLSALRSDELRQAEASSAAGLRRYEQARGAFMVLLLAGVAGGSALGLWFLVIRPLRRAGASEDYRRRFHDALEMADTEEEALDVTGRALGQAAPRVAAELLLADSSQAHLYRALVAGPDPAGPGWQVQAPCACAAVRRGQTPVFASSEDVGACPRLRDRPGGACSAVCTPVTVLGRTIGVLHAVGPEGSPPAEAARDVLETTGAQIGSRLGVIRAMSQSQLQASTDPLTGLLNRRSLEDRVRDLRRARVPFVVAMADLDHFKDLNDQFGHETGDRALRLFSRTLADTVRTQDIVARHGGEEFVVVFPRCSAGEAAEVLERVREALASAVLAAEVPEFTYSVGVADAGPDDSFHDVLRAADEALLSAKRAGRDRVLIAPTVRGAL